MQDKIQILLGDPRHDGTGRHSCFMPLGIGFLASYALSKLGSMIDVSIHVDPTEIMETISRQRPRVVGLANYSWNANLVELIFSCAKKVDPNIICVAGGPEFPTERNDCRDYLLARRDIDFYVYSEGEVSFQLFLEKVLFCDLASLRSNPHLGIASLDSKCNLVYGERPDRISDLNVIPSPYLGGLMDKWFDGSHSPSIAIARGCPYSCSYCFMANPLFNRIYRFSDERMKEELLYIAKRISKYPHVLLLICDSNFGMYKSDENIARYMSWLQNEFNWPNNFAITTGKDRYDRIMKITDLLKNKMQITCGIQSLNPGTLAAINRENIRLENYVYIAENLKKRNMGCAAEVIAPLPIETKETFCNGLCDIITNIKPDRIIPYTTIMLKGTELSSHTSRNKYGMRTKFRIIPRQVGTYNGEKCIETEEVCISTNTMSFEDYSQVRGFALIASFFCGEEFDIIHRHLAECEIDVKTYMEFLWNKISHGRSTISQIYHNFIEETANELWDSRESIVDFYHQDENYCKLERAEVGDNLVRRYSTDFLSQCCAECISLFYECFTELSNPIHAGPLAAAERWALASRNVSRVFDSSYKDYDVNVKLSHDVNKWYNEDKPLHEYCYPVICNFKYPIDSVGDILQSSKDLYGGDREYQVSRFLTTWNFATVWATVTYV